MPLILLAFVVGAGQWVWHGWQPEGAAIVVLIAALWFGQRLAHQYQRFLTAMTLALAAMCGALIGQLQLQGLLKQQLPVELEGQTFRVTWEVVSLPVLKGDKVRFEALVRQAESVSNLDFKRVQLSWYRAPVAVRPGDLWQGTVRLKRPRGAANFGGFDYHAHLLSRKLVAVGTVRGSANYLGQKNNRAAKRAARLSLLEDDRLTAKRFFQALLVADKRDVQDRDWETLQNTGTIHLLAISGLHIGIVGFWGFWLGRQFGKLMAVCHRRGAQIGRAHV